MSEMSLIIRRCSRGSSSVALRSKSNDIKKSEQMRRHGVRLLCTFNHQSLKDLRWWQDFYKRRDSKHFDWFEVDSNLALRIMRTRLSKLPTPAILHLGCGVSRWSELIEECFPHAEEIVHLDASATAVSALAERLPPSSKSRLIVADARELPFYTDTYNTHDECIPDEGFFDAIIDKGTLDLWMMQEETEINDSARVLHEVARVLRPNGFYFMVSTDDPTLRIPSFHQAAAHAAQKGTRVSNGSSFKWDVSCQDVSCDEGQYKTYLYTAQLIA